MNILAIDTSSKYLCLAISSNGKIIGKLHKDLGRELSRLIIPSIDKVFKKAGLSLNEIDCFCAGLGPGSFTGLRIGMATVKGFAFALNKPAVGVVSLDVIARAVSAEGRYICPIIDAKRALVYSALYKKGEGGLKRKGKYLLVSVKELLRLIKGGAVFCGDGIGLYRGYIEKHFGKRAVFSDSSIWYPSPESLISLAEEKIEKRGFSDAGRLVPLYLYPKECQVRSA